VTAIVTEHQKPQAKDLPYIFANLVRLYTDKGMKPCATKNNQTWRHASSNAAAERLLVYHDYIPELNSLCSSLDSYSICEVHYNQIIVTNKFYQVLSGDIDTSSLRKKRSRGDINIGSSSGNANENFNTTSSIKFTEGNETVLMEELQKTKRLLELCEQESWKKSQIIMDLNDKILQLSHQLTEAQNENKALVEQWNSHFSTQQKCINSIMEIALAECDSLYNDIKSLIRDNSRFSLENLINYTPQSWLSKHNQVIVKFIETLTQNNNDDDISQEKLFKRAVAVDSIYGSRHGKYVSEINLAASAVKYSIEHSKKVINIDNHIISAGSYPLFQNLLE